MKLSIARPGWNAILFGGLCAAVLGVSVALGWQLGSETDPPAARVFRGAPVSDDAPTAAIAGIVSEIDADSISVRDASGPIAVRVPPDAAIQVLRRVDTEDVQPGDWVIVGGIDDNVNTFVVQGIVVLAPEEMSP